MTDAKHVKIEIDMGWVVVARQDPVAILNKYKDRVIALHVKDVGKRERRSARIRHPSRSAKAPSTGRRSSAPRTPMA